MNILSRQKHQYILGELDLKTRDTTIQNVKETKYIGLQIDRHLTRKSTWIQSRGKSPVPYCIEACKTISTTEHLEELVYKHSRDTL